MVLGRQRIHLKNQALLSSKDKSKKLKCHLLQFLFGTIRVKKNTHTKTIDIQTETYPINTIHDLVQLYQCISSQNSRLQNLSLQNL